MSYQKISASKLKHLKQLHQKKYRQKYNQFIVEGFKSIQEFVNSHIKCTGIYASEGILESLNFHLSSELFYQTSSKQLSQITQFKNHQDIVASFEILRSKTINFSKDFILALENISDPGNLGTIIRTVDWFGLTQVVCSLQTVDCYNYKCIQASMGSLAHVDVVYLDLKDFLNHSKKHQLVIADLNGTPYYEFQWGKSILLIGNEAHGISEEMKKLAKQSVFIPGKGKAESLNAAISTGILIANATL